MNAGNNRIAVFTGQADEGTQSRFVMGVTERAFEKGIDVCVFSMLKKYQDTPEREAGDSNIFAVANPAFFDGCIIMKDTIQTAGAAQRLEERLHESFDGPVVVVDADSEYYPSIFMDGYNSVRSLTAHLIDVHGAKDIAFFTGKRWHKHSLERQAGFTDEMKSRCFEVPDYRIVEGDYWYQSGERCVEFLLEDEHPLPQAVVCACDQLAIGACKAFAENGVRVPEDVIVVGNDSCYEGQSSPKSITSYQTPAREFGSYAVDCLLELSEGRQIGKFTVPSKLMLGETCGCNSPDMPSFSKKRLIWDTEISLEGYDSVNNTMFENLMTQTDVADYVRTVYSYAFQLREADGFHLCLPGNIRYMGQGDVALPGHDGYPPRMIEAIRHRKDHANDMVGLESEFDTTQMLPRLFEKCDKPRAFFFVPVFYEERNFGYAVVEHAGHPGAYDDVFRRWLGTVTRGFEVLRRQMAVIGLQDQIDNMRANKFVKMVTAYQNMSSEEQADYDTVKQILDENLLTYHFQPIVSAQDGSIYSYEALMRSKSERRVSPLTIIKYADMMDRLMDVEKATFNNVLDIVDEHWGELQAKVFINSIPGVSADHHEKLADRLSERSDKVVVELTEEAELSDEQLSGLQDFFRKLNIEIAVDDFGTGYSNISNLLRYMPDYVKIDRSLLSDIHNRPQKQHFVREIIEFCHNNHIKALAEGVETTEELRTVILMGADLIQGYYTAKPTPEMVAQIDEKVIGEIRSFQQEKKDGKAKRAYIAGKTNRVSMLSLIKENCTDIIVGRGEITYKDITIVGTPSMKTDIHLSVEPGYSGRITLENVYFSNVKERPCIDIGENADVICVIEGENVLRGCGFRVPESSRFCLEGNGNLMILPNERHYYGIGNDITMRHGELLLRQVGKLTVDARGSSGICIGSGAGGKIFIDGGTFLLSANGDKSVAIGSYTGEDQVMIHNCGLEVELSVAEGVGAGSLQSRTMVHVNKSYTQFSLNGNLITGLGTVHGKSAQIDMEDCLVEFNIQSADSTCIGALRGETQIKAAIATLRIEGSGDRVLAVGGISEETSMQCDSVDLKVILHNATGIDTNAPADAITMVNGRCRIFVNDREIERKLTYKYD
ncbi:MAG: EAL domain-containing protein [Lachnospiraceae bacterium]|nr:EAL domain-containing protein [Lachnospiraceae bacterium]